MRLYVSSDLSNSFLLIVKIASGTATPHTRIFRRCGVSNLKSCAKGMCSRYVAHCSMRLLQNNPVISVQDACASYILLGREGWGGGGVDTTKRSAHRVAPQKKRTCWCAPGGRQRTASAGVAKAVRALMPEKRGMPGVRHLSMALPSEAARGESSIKLTPRCCALPRDQDTEVVQGGRHAKAIAGPPNVNATKCLLQQVNATNRSKEHFPTTARLAALATSSALVSRHAGVSRASQYARCCRRLRGSLARHANLKSPSNRRSPRGKLCHNVRRQ